MNPDQFRPLGAPNDEDIPVFEAEPSLPAYEPVEEKEPIEHIGKIFGSTFEDTSDFPTPNPEDAAPRPPSNEVPQERRNFARANFMLVVGLVVAGFAVIFVIHEMMTATSLQGATLGNLIHVRAAAPGTVSDVAFKENTVVRAGDTVMTLDPLSLKEQLSRLDDVAKAKTAEADRIDRSIAEEKERLTLLFEVAKRTLTMMEQQVEGTSVEVALATELSKEMETSYRRGSAKKFEYLEVESRRLRADKQLEEQKTALNLQKLVTEHAEKGRIYHDGEIRSLLDELEVQAATVQTELGQIEYEKAVLGAQLAQTDIRAHRPGNVYAVHQQAGSSVQPGDTLMTLETDDKVFIIASFKADEAQNIAYGDHAEIRIPALAESVGGIVRAIGQTALGSLDADSPFLRLTSEEVLVKIEPERDLPGLRTGLRANVRVRTTPMNPLAWLFPTAPEDPLESLSKTGARVEKRAPVW